MMLQRSLCLLLSSISISAVAQTTAEIELLDGTIIQGDPAQLVTFDESPPPARGALNFADQTTADSAARASLGNLLQIRWRGTGRLIVTSGPDTQCATLGADVTSSLPADWSMEGASLAWKAAEVPRIFHEWRHLPGAQWVWTEPTWFNTDHRERAVFRQDFDMPSDVMVVEAKLLVAVDDQLIGGRLNGVDLSLQPHSESTPLSWDVTHAIRPGPNRIALIAMDNPPVEFPAQQSRINAAGLAFRIELHTVPRGTEADPPATCIVHLANGDCVTGRLREIDDSRIAIATGMGNLSIDRDWVTELLVSANAVPTGSNAVTNDSEDPAPIIFSEPRQVPDWAPGILLADGTHLSGRVLRSEQQGVVVKPKFSDAWMVNFGDIRTIYINGNEEDGYFHYPSQNGPRVCRVTTVAGDRFSGILNAIGGTVEINVPEMLPVQIPVSQLVDCTFPMSSRLWATRTLAASDFPGARQIKIWGNLRTASDSVPYEQNIAAQVQQIASDLGFTTQWIDDMRLASGQLRADIDPVLLVLDDREEFPFSVRKTGDGLASLRYYLNSGGTLILIPAGTPFYRGREWNGTSWQARSLRDVVPNALGFNYLGPGDWRPDARAFEVPENNGQTLLFERIAQSAPWNLLPERLVFPSLEDSRFRPILPAEGHGSASTQMNSVYRLVSDRGEHCGVAMAVVQHTEGDMRNARIYHVSPALAQARDELGEPALHRILPAILADALVHRTAGAAPDSAVALSD